MQNANHDESKPEFLGTAGEPDTERLVRPVRREAPGNLPSREGKASDAYPMAKTLHLTVFDRIEDTLLMALLRAGIKIGTMSLLTVRGRKSGQLHTVPVLLVEQDKERFLVAPYGVVQWVRNIRVVGTATLTRSRRAEAIHVRELEAKEAAPILKQYLLKATATRPYFDVTKDSPLDAFEREAARHPVFQITTA